MITPKSQLVANINNEIIDNGDGLISPNDVRHNLIDIIDSVHLLTEQYNLNALNFATPDTRSTRAGEKTLEKLSLDGYFSTDNSAFGYAALRSNYQGVKNTAIGSQALSCNIYGESNTALGYNALAGNTTGYGNIGIGNNTLTNNKIGHFNIAIGHSAGYYVTRDTNYKLFIASHPVESDYICANPLGSGLTPLVFGDLNVSNLKFGVAVKSLHNAGTLQVSGGISPHLSSTDDLGHSSYRFKRLYLSNSLEFPSGKSISYSYDNGSTLSNNNILPSLNRTYTLGASGSQWSAGHFYDIYVSGTAYIENYVRTTISDCTYECKTLYLASSGTCGGSETGCGYLSDQYLIGAGLVIKSSGNNYLRDYSFTFNPSGNEVINLESNNIYSKSFWISNVSLHIASGNHLKTDRVISSGKLSLVTDPSGYGLFINKENVYLSRENIIPPLVNPASGDIAGLGQINFIQGSGNCSDFNFVVGSLESGVSISQRFINGIKRRTKDNLNNNKDKLSGFELKYYDDLTAGYVGGLSDRFAIRSFDYSSDSVNNLLLMKNDPNGGVFGINNFTTGGDTLFPKTIFNIRSKDNAVARITAENVSSGVHSALQLLGGSNCLQDGFETIYYHDSGIVDLNLYQDSGKLNIYRFTPYQAALFSSGISNATLTMGCSGFPYAAISLKDNTFTTGSITATSGYGKIYNVKVARESVNQSHALYFMDASGYVHDLTNNPYDVTGNSLYTESYTSPNTYGGNTYAGFNSPKTRISFSQVRLGNTSYGTEALHHLASGDRNVAIGFRAGSGINNGTNNTIIGAFAGTTITSGNNNIVIGTSALLNASGYINNNIIIGDGVGTNFKDSYKFLLGYDSIILISGSIGPSSSNKVLALPTSGLLEINSYDNFDKLKLNHDSLEIFNQAGTYPQHNLTFKFSTPSGTSNLLTLNNSVAPSGSGNYSCSGLPYAELNGNLKLLNNICFSDGTTLKSSSFLTTLSTVQSGVNSHETRLNSLFVEGIANQNINPPSNSNTPTVGLIRTKLSNWADGPNITIKNRDTLLKINQGDYVVAIYINGEYRPIWVSTEVLVCNNCNP